MPPKKEPAESPSFKHLREIEERLRKELFAIQKENGNLLQREELERLRDSFAEMHQALRDEVNGLRKQLEVERNAREAMAQEISEAKAQARMAHDTNAEALATMVKLEPVNCIRELSSLASGIIVQSNQSGHPLSPRLERELCLIRDASELPAEGAE